MKAMGLGTICAILVVGMLCGAALGDRTFDIKVHQGKKNKAMTQWSKEFSGPAGFRIKGVEVYRRNASGGSDNVTDDWTPSVETTERGDLNVVMEPDTPVPYCTWLIFRVKTNATTVGVDRGSDREYDNAADSQIRSCIDSPHGFACSVDSACFAGGATGTYLPELGIAVPPNQYAYLYQVNHLGGDNAIKAFAVEGAYYFSNFQVMSASHNGEALFDNITDHDTGEEFEDCGIALFSGLGDPTTSVFPDYWCVGGTEALAAFTGTPIDNGESSTLLLAYSPRGPRNWNDANVWVGAGPLLLPQLSGGIALAPEPVPGDANGDSKVDGGDLAIWQQNYDPLGEDNDPFGGFANGDFNRDGKIDGGDLALWQQNYDPIGFMPGPTGTDGAQVPEPTTLVLLGTGLAGACVLRRRRHLRV